MFKYFCVLFVLVVLSDGEPDCPRMKLKRQWGGKPSEIINFRPVPIKYVIIHHTVTGECTTFLECAEVLQNMQHHHINTLDFDDIGYKVRTSVYQFSKPILHDPSSLKANVLTKMYLLYGDSKSFCWSCCSSAVSSTADWNEKKMK